jgi:4-hydroxy 2-oxovalerate aldolase
LDILETTLRDGSYAINFAFTRDDTESICSGLEEVGFRYIEIGHGVGINASNRGHGCSFATDEEYMLSAMKVLKKAYYGVFCIPGIATTDSLESAISHGIGFVRIGTDVDRIKEAEPFIRIAKDRKIYVTTNLMKSYALTPKQFAKKVEIMEDLGSDVVYLVDSSGGMFPADIEHYFDAIRSRTSIPLGFHGHNNLGMAVANTMRAVELGFQLVDSSLQGIGRSSGNACTEHLVACLKKTRHSCDIDFLKLLVFGNQVMEPFLSKRGEHPLDIVSGYADFHSSYMPHIKKYSDKYNVDPLVLIVEMTKKDKVNIDELELERIAVNLRDKGQVMSAKFQFNKYEGKEQDAK